MRHLNFSALFALLLVSALFATENAGSVEVLTEEHPLAPIFIVPASDEDQASIDSALLEVTNLETQVEELRGFETAANRAAYYKAVAELRKQQSNLCNMLSSITADEDAKRFYRIKAHNINQFASKYLAKYYASLSSDRPTVSQAGKIDHDFGY